MFLVTLFSVRDSESVIAFGMEGWFNMGGLV